MSRLGLLLSFASAAALAQSDAGVPAPLQLRARAVPDKAKLGEPFAVEVVITHERAQRYELSTPTDLGEFDYVETVRGRVDGADNSTTTFHVKLAGFSLGKQRTPALTFEVADPHGLAVRTEKLTVAGVEIELVSTLPADAQEKGESLYDVRPPEEVPIRTWRLLYALAALAAAGLLGYGLYRFLNRPKPLALAPPKPAEPLHVRATTALDALAQENLPAQGRVKEFYFRLSEILRGYLGELYGFEALESTTPELLDALRTRATPGLPMQELTAFTHASDFVRYAKTIVSPDECRSALELGYRLIHATTAVPVAAKTNGSGHLP